jgi:hypothetical protein
MGKLELCLTWTCGALISLLQVYVDFTLILKFNLCFMCCNYCVLTMRDMQNENCIFFKCQCLSLTKLTPLFLSMGNKYKHV